MDGEQCVDDICIMHQGLTPTKDSKELRLVALVVEARYLSRTGMALRGITHEGHIPPIGCKANAQHQAFVVY
jgi:hypothetical protein